MDIEKYRTFITAADCSSFAAAAEILFLTTPTVTKHISAIEQEMGVKLFERTPQGIMLTEEGIQRLALAQQIVNSYDALNNMNRGRTLIIYSVPCLEKIGLPAYLRGFAKARPEIKIKLKERNGAILVDDLRKKRCELAFLGDAYAYGEDLEVIPIFHGLLCVAVPDDHPLASRKKISLRELKDDDFIMLPPETGMPYFLEKCCKRCGFMPKVTTFCSREDSMLSLVASGMGVAFYTYGKTRCRENSGVHILELEEAFFSGCVLARLKGETLSTPAAAFWKYMTNITK